MKKLLSLLLVLCVLLCAGCFSNAPTSGTTTVPATTAPTVPETTAPPINYANSTVVLYTANVRGDVTVYSQIVAVRKAYEALGATVYLVDAGNYLQGTAYANADMGLTIYNLMDAAGYDVAGVGVYDLVHGEAEVGYAAHGDLTKFYTQAQLFRGTAALRYRQNAAWAKEPVMATREAKAAAGFRVICSNLAAGEAATGYYNFDPYAVLSNGLVVGFVSSLPEDAAAYVQDDFLAGYTYQTVSAPACHVLVALGGGEGDIVIEAPADGSLSVGAYIINQSTAQVTFEPVTLSDSDPQMDALIASLTPAQLLGTSSIMFTGSRQLSCNGQTQLGTLVADALKWYAETYMEGIEYPVIGLFNGGNCRNFLYSGQITETDLRNALHGSAKGMGVIYLTGAQLLEALEAATQREDCPGWANVSGIDYLVDTEKAFDFGYAYGLYYKAASVNRVSITTENFDPAATYAVATDLLLLGGEDTYYLFKEQAIVARGETGLDTCAIVARYIQEALGGQLGGDLA